MRYRTRRHKLGSQGTGDAAGFTISPPAIALFSLFLSHTLTTTHSLHLTLALRDRSRPFSLFLSNSLSQRGSYANSRLSRTVRRELLPPEISRRNRGDKVEAGKLFRRAGSASRAFAEISSPARAKSLAGSTRFALGE